MSTAFGLLTVVKALESAEKFTGTGPWSGSNFTQSELLSRLPAIRRELHLIPTLEGWADEDADVLNQILADHGLEIKLQPWQKSGDAFGMVAINSFGVQWLVEGDVSHYGKPIMIKDRPAFRLKKDAGVLFSDDQNPTVQVPTKSGDVVYFAKSSRQVQGFDLLRAVADLERNFAPYRYSNYAGVDIPKVKFSHQPDMGWLLGLSNGSWSLVQALQEIQFGMDQNGAEVVEATAASAVRSLPQYYQLDEAFLMWIRRPQVSEPLFSAWITPDDWRDPKAQAAVAVK